MFFNASRYRKLPDVATLDAQGRLLASKSLRLLPNVPASFKHTVEEGDRLDQLASKYYRQPRKWWRICDANPQVLSPWALLGKEPFVTTRFRLTLGGTGQPPWATAARSLMHHLGVERVGFVDEVRLTPEQQVIDGQTVVVHVERHEYGVAITYNRLKVSVAELAAILAAAGFGVGQPELVDQVGQSIAIPPDVVG